MIAVFILILIIVLILLGGGLFAYKTAFYSPKAEREKWQVLNTQNFPEHREKVLNIQQSLRDRPCEFVTITSRDGLILSGRYYHVQEGAPLDICFHGYKSSPMTDFCGGSRLSLEMGHNLLLVDQRCHGSSQGMTITFGLRERYDCLSWIEYANNRFGEGTPIFLYGISMGAATVLMASGLDLPGNVKGIIADCPYNSPMDIILHVGKNMPIPLWLIRPFVILGAKVFGGFDILETWASKEVAKSRIPVLLIHGGSDSLVPDEMSKPIYEANPSMVSYHIIPDAEHGISFLVDTPRYKSLVKDFVGSL